MKRLRMFWVILLVISLSGCIKEYNYTEEESASVAEYMAGLLLKYDDDYNQDLALMGQQLIEEKDETDIEPENSEADTQENSKGDTAAQEPSNQTSDTKQTYSISDIIGVKDFEIQYQSHKITETYPEDTDNTYFTLTPRSGYQLLVCEFSLKNNTKKERTLNLTKEKIQYQLDVNIGTFYKPLLTLLENDLQYINIKLKKQESKTVLLIYEIPEGKEFTDINLIISKDKKSEIIKIK